MTTRLPEAGEKTVGQAKAGVAPGQPAPSACCRPAEQATCCEPAAKTACCRSQAEGCGCR